MNAADILSEARRAGIVLSVHGDKLRVEAGPGAVTHRLRALFADTKPELLRLIRAEGAAAAEIQRRRVVSAIRAEGLPDHIAVRSDATAEQLAGLDAETLRAYVRSLAISAEREAGRIPAGWRYVGYCDGCGPVWLWKPIKAIACPWCWNRVAGRPVPRPAVAVGERERAGGPVLAGDLCGQLFGSVE